MNKMEHVFLNCVCSTPEHTIRFSYFKGNEEVYVAIYLSSFPFWKRLYYGLKYILGLDVPSGHYFEETVLNYDELDKLIKTLEDIKNKSA